MATFAERRQLDLGYSDMVIQAIESKVGDRQLKCPVCTQSEWAVQDHQGVLPAIDPFDYETYWERLVHAFPVAVVTCDACGYTMMFNLFMLGIAEPSGVPIPSMEGEYA